MEGSLAPTPVPSPRPAAPLPLPSLQSRGSRTKDRSDANRNATIVASIRGRANWGLQASSRLSRFSLRLKSGSGSGLLVLIEGLVVGVEEVVDVEGGVKGVGVVVSHMIELKREGVGEREDAVLKELTICQRGCRIVEVAAEISVRQSVMAEIVDMVEEVGVTAVGSGEVIIQGRCSSD